MDSGKAATVNDAEVGRYDEDAEPAFREPRSEGGLYDEDTEPAFREPLSLEHRMVIVGLVVVAFLGAAIPIAVSARDVDRGWLHPFKAPAVALAVPAVAASVEAVEPPAATAETLEAVAAPVDSMLEEEELAADEELVADEELAAVLAADLEAAAPAELEAAPPADDALLADDDADSAQDAPLAMDDEDQPADVAAAEHHPDAVLASYVVLAKPGYWL